MSRHLVIPAFNCKDLFPFLKSDHYAGAPAGQPLQAHLSAVLLPRKVPNWEA